MSMKWMGCLNHDLPYSIDNPSEKPIERRATQNWRAPTEKREKKNWRAPTEKREKKNWRTPTKRERKKSLVFHKPFTAYTILRYRHHHDGRMRIRQHGR